MKLFYVMSIALSFSSVLYSITPRQTAIVAGQARAAINAGDFDEARKKIDLLRKNHIESIAFRLEEELNQSMQKTTKAPVVTDPIGVPTPPPLPVKETVTQPTTVPAQEPASTEEKKKLEERKAFLEKAIPEIHNKIAQNKAQLSDIDNAISMQTQQRDALLKNMKEYDTQVAEIKKQIEDHYVALKVDKKENMEALIGTYEHLEALASRLHESNEENKRIIAESLYKRTMLG